VSQGTRVVRLPALVDLFRQVLEDEEVTSDSDFFTCGGDSLLATRVISRIARDYDIELTFAEFTQAPTPRALRALLTELPAGTPS
jgi:acyl carrier protein